MPKTIIFSLLIFLSISVNGQDFTQIAGKIMERDSIPEMAFAVVTKDSIIIKKVLGHHKISEIDDKSDANLSDYFHLGSNTKAITSFVIAKLVESEKIDWNTKFFDLFPDLIVGSHTNYKHITLADLLAHKANIQPFTSGAAYQKLPKFTGNKQEMREKFSQYVLTLPPFDNSNKYNYSNAGYSVATLMAEKVSGKSWEELINIFLSEELNIDVAFGWPNRNFENQPYGHWSENGKIVSIYSDNDYNLKMAEPAGDLSMNIENYAKFIQLNLLGLAGQDNFLKSRTYKFLHTASDEYALGWGNYTKNDEAISEHAGSDGTFFSYSQIDRKKLIGYIVLVNSGAESAQLGVFEMINHLKNNKK